MQPTIAIKAFIFKLLQVSFFMVLFNVPFDGVCKSLNSERVREKENAMEYPMMMTMKPAMMMVFETFRILPRISSFQFTGDNSPISLGESLSPLFGSPLPAIKLANTFSPMGFLV